MKKIFYLFASLMLVTVACAKKEAPQEADDESYDIALVEEETPLDPNGFITMTANTARNVCPKVVDALTTLVDISYDADSKQFVYNYEIDETQTSISAIAPNAEAIGNVLINVINETPAIEPLLKNLTEVGGKIYHVYTGSKSGKSFSIVINPEDKSFKVQR